MRIAMEKTVRGTFLMVEVMELDGAFNDVKIGDTVTRMLAGTIPMKLKVTEVTDTLIVCGSWSFDRATGVEEDADLEWGVQFGKTGSYLVRDE